jgi:hypothetical protein
MDFLENINATINVRKQILKTTFGQFKLFKNKTNSCARIQVAETVSVPPKSEYIFQARVDKPFEGIGLIEPTKSLASKGLFLARSLCNPNMGAVTVAVLNTREKPVTLERESIFGTMVSVSEIVTEIFRQTHTNTQIKNCYYIYSLC